MATTTGQGLWRTGSRRVRLPASLLPFPATLLAACVCLCCSTVLTLLASLTTLLSGQRGPSVKKLSTVQAAQPLEPYILVVDADMLFRRPVTPALLGALPGARPALWVAVPTPNRAERFRTVRAGTCRAVCHACRCAPARACSCANPCALLQGHVAVCAQRVLLFRLTSSPERAAGLSCRRRLLCAPCDQPAARAQACQRPRSAATSGSWTAGWLTATSPARRSAMTRWPGRGCAAPTWCAGRNPPCERHASQADFACPLSWHRRRLCK